MNETLTAPLAEKLDRLHRLFLDMGSVLVAFSGGIDSTLVYKVARDAIGDRAVAVTAVSPTLPAVELDLARRVAAEIGGRHLVIETDQLARSDFARNDASRCYHCKADLYEALTALKQEAGLAAIADGTNVDDLGDDRPGITAARQWEVRSPLVEAQCSKDDIRTLARTLGISTWDKPAAACLSSRIPRGIAITREKLTRVERAEAVLFEEGFRQVRVRDQGDCARIEVGADELAAMLTPTTRARVVAGVQQAGFRFVTLDLEGYRTGSTNEPSRVTRDA